MRRLLYFPLAEPPETVALRAALYWDELVSIRPPRHEPASPLLRAFEDDGLFRTVDLDETLGFARVDRILDEVVDALGTLPPVHLRPDPRVRVTEANRFLRGKLPVVVESELENRGSVMTVDDRTLATSPAVHSVVLAVLARHAAHALNERDGEGTTSIYTDRDHLLAQAIDGLPGASYPAWQVELGRWLPTPTAGVDPQDVLRFRHERADERRRLTAAVTRLASAVAPGGFVDVAVLAREVDDAYRDLDRTARERNLRLRRTAMTAVVGASVAAATEGIGQALEVADVPAGLVGPGLAVLEHLAQIGVAAWRVQVRSTDERLAYLAQVKRAFPTATPGGL